MANAAAKKATAGKSILAVLRIIFRFRRHFNLHRDIATTGILYFTVYVIQC